MSEEFASLSDLEIQALIGRAEHELQRRKLAIREKLKTEIEEKLRSSGFELDDLFPDAVGRGRKARSAPEAVDAPQVKAKYRDPVSLETWSGRGGRPPYWVKKIMAERGWTLDDFKKSGEYDA